MLYFDIEFGMQFRYFKGGGGGAGVVDFPVHMKDFHKQMLDHNNTDVVTLSLVEIHELATGNSPFTVPVAYDPDTELADMLTSVTDLETLVNLLSAGTGLDAIIADVLSDARIDDAVTEYSADLGDILDAEVTPRFEAGMRNINAVVSSAFALGRAIIEDGQTREVAKYSAAQHMKAFGDDALRLIALKLDYQKNLTHLTAEANRIKIAAKSGEAESNLGIDEADALWDIKLFQYGANLLASIGSGTALPKEKSQAQQALGGAMVGAAAGAYLAAPTGGMSIVAGAVIGGILGAGASFL